MPTIRRPPQPPPRTTPSRDVPPASGSSTPTSPTGVSNEPMPSPSSGVGSDVARRLSSTDGQRAAETREVLKTFFAPYDDPIKQDIALIQEVIEAKKADPRTFEDGNNPYKIQFAVYNLRNPEVIRLLGEAAKQGVDVQVLIEDHQLDPAKDFNTADEQLIAAGFQFSKTHRGLSDEQKQELDLIGIEGSGLMHLKTRIFTRPDPVTAEPIEKMLTGSLNPGDAAPFNNETLHLITDKQLIARYKAKYQAVLDDKDLPNEWVQGAAVNVLFTPAKEGPHPADKILELIDKEQEAIFLSVFSLRNFAGKESRGQLLDKLQKAKERGVPIVVVTDRKQSDGTDAQGNRIGWDDKTEDKLRELGIPVYECTNTAGPYNAMHNKSAIFGLSNMKVVTDCGNWTKAALGSSGRRAKNDESFLFIESGKLDDNATGLRYLSNFLYLLRSYEGQQHDGDPGAKALVDQLSQHPAWPKVEVDFDVFAQTYFGQEVYITGDHPALGDWTRSGPGLKLKTDGASYPTWKNESKLKLPFGTTLEYKVVKRDARTGELSWEPGNNQILVVDPADLNHSARDGEGGLDVKDRFG